MMTVSESTIIFSYKIETFLRATQNNNVGRTQTMWEQYTLECKKKDLMQTHKMLQIFEFAARFRGRCYAQGRGQIKRQRQMG